MPSIPMNGSSPTCWVFGSLAIGTRPSRTARRHSGPLKPSCPPDLTSISTAPPVALRTSSAKRRQLTTWKLAVLPARPSTSAVSTPPVPPRSTAPSPARPRPPSVPSCVPTSSQHPNCCQFLSWEPWKIAARHVANGRPSGPQFRRGGHGALDAGARPFDLPALRDGPWRTALARLSPDRPWPPACWRSRSRRLDGLPAWTDDVADRASWCWPPSSSLASTCAAVGGARSDALRRPVATAWRGCAGPCRSTG